MNAFVDIRVSPAAVAAEAAEEAAEAADSPADLRVVSPAATAADSAADLRVFSPAASSWAKGSFGMLRSPALPDSATVDIAPHLSAYTAAGIESPVLAGAMASLVRLTRPRIISTQEFEDALDVCAAQLYGSLAAERVVFLVSSGVKSNLWVFLMLMHSIASNYADGWAVLRSHIFLGLKGYFSGTGIAVTQRQECLGTDALTTLVITNDCSYSGWQLAGMASGANTVLCPHRVIVCPVYATLDAVENISQSFQTHTTNTAPPLSLTLCVPQTIGNSKNLANSLGYDDVAMCVRMHGSKTSDPWLVFSLFSLLGVVRHSIVVASEKEKNCYVDMDTMWFKGDTLRVRAYAIGSAAVVFQHKVADMVSVPTQWFTLGPTLRRGVESMNPLMDSASLSRTEVAILPMAELMTRIDYNPRAKGNRIAGRRWSVVNVYDGIGMSQSCILVCDASIITPAAATAGGAAAKPKVAKPKDAKPKVAKPKVANVVGIAKLPAFVPLLRPDTACGTEFSETQRTGSGNWWSAKEAHNMMSGMMSGIGVEDDSAPMSPCINAPYKENLASVIRLLVKQKKSVALARALGVTDAQP
eukprot:gene10920-17038_t